MSETPSIPRLWRSGEPRPPGARRRAGLLVVLLALTVLAGVGIGLLYWLSPPREVAVLPVSITAGASGPVPWAEQDRAALTSAGLLGRPLDDPGANPSRDQIRLRFAALAKVPKNQPVVIHLAAPAAVDAAGAVFLLPGDPGGDSPRNRLTLAELLAAVRDCPARHKLLILSLTPPAEDPLFAPPPGNLSAATFAALDAVPDDTRLSLVSCGPGQTTFASPELGRSVFSYYLEAGLKGAADEDRDGRVTVRELAAFTRARVARWAVENRGTAQTPTLVGTAPDFVLRAASLSAAIEEPAVGEIGYPDWLRAGWETLPRWHTDGRASAAPRAYRHAQAALLAAERDLRAGVTAEQVKRTLDARLAAADQLAAELRAVPTPDPLPTLAAVFPGYALPDPALVEQLRTAAIAAESRAAPAPAPPQAAGAVPAAPPVEPPLPPEFDAFKARPHAQLAAAAFLVLADDPDPSPVRVKNFARLLAAQEPLVKYAEVLLIRRLAAIADQKAVLWSGERAALAIQTARWLEDVSTRLEVIEFARPALDDAYRLRAGAEAVLFAPGFASPEEATARLRAAEAAARKLKLAADRLQAALATRDATALWLAGVTPLVTVGVVNETEAVAVAATLARLNAVLPCAGDYFTADALADQVPEWDRRATAARAALATANRPLAAESLVAMRRRAGDPAAGPAVVAEIDALLATPLVHAADRAALWAARSDLAQRLCEATLRKDAADHVALRDGLPRTPATEPGGEELYDAALAQRRARWTLALLRAGDGGPAADSRITPLEAEFRRFAADRYAFADQLRRAWESDSPAVVKLSALLPLGRGGALDTPATNPYSAWRRAAAQRLWAWHAARFDYEARDPADPGPAVTGVPYATTAARATGAAAQTAGFPFLEVVEVKPAGKPDARPTLTFQRTTAPLNLTVRAVGAPATASVRALTPSDEWLKAVPSVTAKLDAIRESPLALTLMAGDKPTAHPLALGVLVEAEAELNGVRRTFHRRVPVDLRTLANRIDLYVRTDPKADPQPLAEFRVRPNGVPAAYRLVLVNPSPVPQKVVARLVGLNRETVAITLDPGKPVPLVFTSTAPPLPATPQAAGTAPKPDDGFAPLSDSALTLELLDAADRENVLQTFAVPVAVADPASYLRVSDAVFTPAADGKPNRLSVTVVPGDVPGSAPCPVKMVFPPDRNRGLVVRDGSQAGAVVNSGPSAKLYAENIAFPAPTGADVVVTLSADGVERVFTYAARVPAVGETVRLRAQTDPAVRINAPEYAPGTKPLAVTLEVDNPPADAQLRLLVGTAKDAASPLNADLTLPLNTARARVVKYKFDPKGESFELAGSITDHKPELPVELLTGRRTLEAQLLAAGGEVVASRRVTVTFDGNPPADVAFLDLPARAAKGQPLPVKATCGPTVSGVKDVKFFVGKPNKDELPAAPAPVPGVPSPGGTEWSATLQMPDTKGFVTVGVKFTTNAGLSTVFTQDIELLDAAELNKPAPGKIVGKLTENRIPQGGATVFLYDAKGAALAKATTKPDGSFEFKDLPPGTYYLYSEKVPTNREAKSQADVKAGDTTTQDLELLLK